MNCKILLRLFWTLLTYSAFIKLNSEIYSLIYCIVCVLKHYVLRVKMTADRKSTRFYASFSRLDIYLFLT